MLRSKMRINAKNPHKFYELDKLLHRHGQLKKRVAEVRLLVTGFLLFDFFYGQSGLFLMVLRVIGTFMQNVH
jgi:hypothetical protein